MCLIRRQKTQSIKLDSPSGNSSGMSCQWFCLLNGAISFNDNIFSSCLNLRILGELNLKNGKKCYSNIRRFWNAKHSIEIRKYLYVFAFLILVVVVSVHHD